MKKPPKVVIKKGKKPIPKPPPVPVNPPPPKPKYSPQGIAWRMLGHRLTERKDERGADYYLDGKRVTFAQVMQETNRLLVNIGQPQIDKNPAWRIE